MPEYLSPGVYIEEVASGPRPIQGVGTSTAGFVGLTERGPTTPRLVTSWGDYLRWFGDVIEEDVSFLPYAARGFFENDGQRLFVARVTRNDAVAASGDFDNVRITAIGPGEFGNRIAIRIAEGSLKRPDGTAVGFRLTVFYFRETPPDPTLDPLNAKNIGNPDLREADMVEDYDDLSVQPTDSNYFINRITAGSSLVMADWVDPALPLAAPAPVLDGDNDPLLTPLQGGTDGAAAISSVEYVGDPLVPPDQRMGLAGLEMIDEISLLCVPDEVHPALDAANQSNVMNAVVTQCERLRDRFAILSIGQNQGDVATINPPRDTSYGAVYYPWIRVFNPLTRDTLLVPPAGHVAGIYARTDRERGVHKAPANEVVRDIITRDINSTRKPLEYTLGKREHDILNPRGINVIRDFRADRRGIRVWGARTMSSDPLWRYVNVRRLFLFVEESIDEGTQWVVFEPNDSSTWARVRQSVGNFLSTVWRSGALQGNTEDQAFFVRCGPETMTVPDIDAGRLICEVGIAPVKPAEFVIFRIQQKLAVLTP